MRKIDLAHKLSLFDDHWHPRLIGELNGQHVKVVKVKGAFVWHRHGDEDELFLVLKGRLRLETRTEAFDLDEGQMIIVPRGVEHRTSAAREAHVMLFEPAGTVNTGEVREARTVERLEIL